MMIKSNYIIRKREIIMTTKNSFYNHAPYILFAILSLFSLSLIFSKSIWFDEAYTLSLIQHNYLEIIEILKTDMHPPLYFFALKLFCSIFGYSLITTKIFSSLGYIGALLIGCTIIKKHFGIKISIIYMLTVGAIPMSLYFSVQQRSYSWCIFFVTLCFVYALIFIEEGKSQHCIAFTVSGLFAAYNHIYALLAVGIIFAFVFFYTFFKMKNRLKLILITYFGVVVGYSFWIMPLLYQTKDAANGFWLTGVEPLSLIVFFSGFIISAGILVNKKNRKLPIVFAIVSIMTIQLIGLLVTIFIRPLYIARYSVVILGVFALLIALCINNIGTKLNKVVCILLCFLNIACLVGTAFFEYNPSTTDFVNRFEENITDTDSFIYSDSSFGIMSYYFPDNKHICTYNEPWFSAFSNVDCIEKDSVNKVIKKDSTMWFVKNSLTKTPAYIKDTFDYKKVDYFICDFNTFEVYSLTPKQ